MDQQQHGPHGLSGKSLQDYKVEWSRYEQFAEQNGSDVPGGDRDWDLSVLWRYIQHRAQTCKPSRSAITQILTKLSHFGLRRGHVLANSKFDTKPAEYGRVRNMKKQVTLDARAKSAREGKQYVAVDRCTPVGKRGVDCCCQRSLSRLRHGSSACVGRIGTIWSRW